MVVVSTDQIYIHEAKMSGATITIRINKSVYQTTVERMCIWVYALKNQSRVYFHIVAEREKKWCIQSLLKISLLESHQLESIQTLIFMEPLDALAKQKVNYRGSDAFDTS
jgi:hypothetical protein